MTEVYTQHLRDVLISVVRRLGIRTIEGVYAFTAGPVFETPAEIRAYAHMGADVVGMSTVPEAVFARACGIQVAGLSLVSNLAAGISATPLAHEDVLKASADAKPVMTRICDAFIEAL